MSTEPLQDFVALIAAPRRAPAGVSAAAAGAMVALALMERALSHPAPESPPGAADEPRNMVASLRGRFADVIQADQAAADGLETALADTSEDADAIQAGARVPAYRAARRLVDFSIQGLTLMPHALDHGSRVVLADLEVAWRLLGTALEAGIAACEQHLMGLSYFFAEAERPALEASAQQGREWVERATGDLSWRLGRR
jgi:formiminotetrahydrofolate cyclodeaminase